MLVIFRHRLKRFQRRIIASYLVTATDVFIGDLASPHGMWFGNQALNNASFALAMVGMVGVLYFATRRPRRRRVRSAPATIDTPN